MVRSGDSLYMIAMEFDRDYLDLAQWNGIKPPYRIYRGDQLRLYPPKKSLSGSSTNVTFYTIRGGDTLSGVADQFDLQTARLAKWNRLKPPYTIHVGDKLRVKAPTVRQTKQRLAKKSIQKTTSKTDRKRVKAKSKAKKPKSVSHLSRAKQPSSARVSHTSLRLKRPASGKVVQKFSSKKGMTGVVYQGKRGDPVRSAADGKVVYSGTGLVRYGKLLIVKHDNDLLTAYAHNSQLQVSEGETVKAGQQIAKMGSSGTDRVKLHFEVRKRGKPVDPMPYLSN
jgi:lipoprotein NlpD